MDIHNYFFCFNYIYIIKLYIVRGIVNYKENDKNVFTLFTMFNSVFVITYNNTNLIF